MIDESGVFGFIGQLLSHSTRICIQTETMLVDRASQTSAQSEARGEAWEYHTQHLEVSICAQLSEFIWLPF